MTSPSRIALAGSLTFLVTSGFPAVSGAQEQPEQVTVYIECTPAAGGDIMRGSGVVIDEQGNVLTAKHLVEGDKTCRGSIGVADPSALRSMVLQPTNAPVDVAVLRFKGAAPKESMPFCQFEDWMVRRKIFVAGYPGHTETGAPSFRQGVISTAAKTSGGLLETDGQSIAGMSGGPVFSGDLKHVLGLVIGASSDPGSGLVSYYAILPVADFASSLNLKPTTVPCYPRSRVVEFDTGANRWRSGEPAKRLGVKTGEGFCYLTSVWGEMNDPGDTVQVQAEGDEYVLSGSDSAGGEHGGSAQCVWNE